MAYARLFAKWPDCGAALLVIFVSVTGCGSGVPTYPVRGTVTFEGKPLVGGGSIRFVPTAEGEGREAGGNIAADGTFTLSTNEQDDGAIAGAHRVEVTQNTVATPAVYPDVKPVGEGREPDAVKPTSPEVLVPAADLIPEIYGGPKSPLTATVEAKPNEFKFELKKMP